MHFSRSGLFYNFVFNIFCLLAAHTGLMLFEVYFFQSSKSAVICPSDRQTDECFTLSLIFIP